MNGPSPEWTEYARALRWLRDIGEVLSECRYSSSTPSTVTSGVEALETAAKVWVADATRRMNDAILKREASAK